jgi:hypothetical protein
MILTSKMLVFHIWHENVKVLNNINIHALRDDEYYN